MAIHSGITRADYDALPGINWSALKHGLGKTAAHIKAAKAGRKDSSALRFGRAFHVYVLQPQEWPTWEIKKTATTSIPTAVTEAELAAIDSMAASVASLDLGDVRFPETALTWTYGGVACKCMIDGVWGGVLGDLKSTKDASPAEFGREVLRYKYHAQMAFYLEGAARNGLPVEGARLIAAEKTAPYAAGDYMLDGSWLDLGRKCFEDALEVWADNKGASYGSQVLALPDWMDGDEDFSESEDGISLGSNP